MLYRALETTGVAGLALMDGVMAIFVRTICGCYRLLGRTSVTASVAGTLGRSTAMIRLTGALNLLGLVTALTFTGLLHGFSGGILLRSIFPIVSESIHVLDLGFAARAQRSLFASLLTGGGVGLFLKFVCGVVSVGITANGALMPMVALTVAPVLAGGVGTRRGDGIDLHVRSITVLAAIGFIAIGHTSGFNSFGGGIRSFMIGLIHIFGFAQTAGALKNINTEGGAGSCC